MSRIAKPALVTILEANGVRQDSVPMGGRRRLGWLRSGVLLAGAVFVFAGCQRTESAVAPAPPPPPQVLVSHPVELPLAETREYTGHLEAVETVSIRARVRGVLQKIHFDEGAEVEQGALLYELDHSEYQAAVDEKAADIARLEHELRLRLAGERGEDGEVARGEIHPATVEREMGNSKGGGRSAGGAARSQRPRPRRRAGSGQKKGRALGPGRGG